jgi:hypothetical protein
MRDIKVGDILSHPNGETEVIAIPFEGEDETYEITLDNGKTVECNLNHLWKVSFEKDIYGNPIWKVVPTTFILDNINSLDMVIPDLT